MLSKQVAASASAQGYAHSRTRRCALPEDLHFGASKCVCHPRCSLVHVQGNKAEAIGKLRESKRLEAAAAAAQGGSAAAFEGGAQTQQLARQLQPSRPQQPAGAAEVPLAENELELLIVGIALNSYMRSSPWSVG